MVHSTVFLMTVQKDGLIYRNAIILSLMRKAVKQIKLGKKCNIPVV